MLLNSGDAEQHCSRLPLSRSVNNPSVRPLSAAMAASGVDATTTKNKRKRGRDPPLLDHTYARKKQNTSVKLDFLDLHRGGKLLEELPVEALSRMAETTREHKNILRGEISLARARGQSTSVSALYERTLRSFREPPLILSRVDNRHGDPAVLIDFATRHPTQFQQ